MAKRHFLTWIEKNISNQRDPFFSIRWDRLISHADIQKQIRKDKQAHEIYSYVESSLAHQQAKLIKITLRQAFNNLTEDDLANTAGFSNDKKATPRQKAYFHAHHTLQYYLRRDILEHTSRAARLNAFRRWIDVADILFSRHCYEGGMLVSVTLNLLDSYLRCEDELPAVSRKKLNHLLDMYSPAGNFKRLRQHIKDHQSENSFPLVTVIGKDLTFIDENLNTLQKAMNEFLIAWKNQKKAQKQAMYATEGREGDVLTQKHFKIYHGHKIRSAVKPQHAHSHKKEAAQEKEFSIEELLAFPADKAPAEYNTMRNNYLAAVKEKMDFIRTLLPEKKEQLPMLPHQLQSAYEQTERLYKENGLDSLLEGINANTKKSTLYSEKLLPGFFSRGGRSPEKHWDKLFTYTNTFSA
ncbi:RasGEF domain-containing protein [Legionella erythra]|uniref:RasGEF domain protein n=1 Tax=Legionella erythra TaxID=448 RepID=A0A0W0TQQ4_LEGER|nr:RasGEF domain-containing protein [Legionella erythra]KTC98002.1 RasGEF domain protein [Legionella erythra]